MNDAQVLTHSSFDRPPVLNVKRRGPTPRGVAMIRRERFERECAKQKAQQEVQRELTPEERLAECRAALNELAHCVMNMTVALSNAVDVINGKLPRD